MYIVGAPSPSSISHREKRHNRPAGLHHGELASRRKSDNEPHRLAFCLAAITHFFICNLHVNDDGTWSTVEVLAITTQGLNASLHSVFALIHGVCHVVFRALFGPV